MELLAPAGSFEQAKISIESGCNALYGGLKKWSARNRAINLSFEEYNELIQICKSNNVKFYLTLNTLLSDAELNEICEMLKNKDILIPDGILVADFGLLNVLRNEFPEIEVHASTQLAAYSIEDVKYYESLGIKRVVLARELTLKEIEYIKRNTDVELEVFVYGNQCVVYSGNCLWGGLLHTGSGHRGRCIGACCDIYKKDEQLGNFFWSCNIGLFGMVSQLKAIGVDSIKIEGRVRPLDEIKTVVSKFRKAIDGTASYENDYNYAGYLGGNLPPTGMLNYFNPENATNYIENINLTKYDYIVKKIGNREQICLGNDETKGNYMFTLFSNDHKKNSINIRIRFLFVDSADGPVLSTVDYVNTKGERIFFHLDKGITFDKTSIYDIYLKFKHNIKCNIYECFAKYPANSNILINSEWIDSVISSINDDVIKFQSDSQRDAINQYKTAVISSKNSYVFLDNADLTSDLYNQGYNHFIFFIRNIDEVKKAISLKIDAEIIYQLPYLDFECKSHSIYQFLDGQSIMITRASQLMQANKYSYKQIFADYMLNVWNSESAKFLKQQGVTAIVAHPEITIDSINAIQKNSGVRMLVVKAGSFPLGYTRACFKKLGICNGNCGNETTTLRNILKGVDIQLVCNNIFGYRMIFSKETFISKGSIEPSNNIYSLINIESEYHQNILNEQFDSEQIIIY